MTKAIIVLSHRLEYFGKQTKENSIEYMGRLNVALEHYKSNPDIDYIVLCSETANEESLNFLLNQGVDRGRILLQTESKDTIGEAYFTKIGLPNDCKNLVVVSSDYHINYRVRFIFDYVFGPKYSIDYKSFVTGKMRNFNIMINQINSLKEFMKTFDLYEPIETQIYNKHKLYKG